MLEKERDRLLSLAESAEAELENTSNLPEEAAGKLRAAAGKSRLLATQKMHQFMGLCQKNIVSTIVGTQMIRVKYKSFKIEMNCLCQFVE